MKKFLALILALVMALTLIACGDTNTPADEGDVSAPASTLRFVTGGESGTYYAFGSVLANHATNNAGIDVVGLVGNGSQSNVFEMEDGNAELAFCQSDVMAYAYEGTNLFADTGAVKCFSTVAALYTEQVQIVTLNPDIKTVADLKGKKIAVQIGTTGEKKGRSVEGAKVTAFNANTEAIMELKNKGVDAVINDAPVVGYYLAQGGDKHAMTVGEIMEAEQYGMAVKKGNKQLLADLNKGLAELKKNGEYDKLYKKWFGEAAKK